MDSFKKERITKILIFIGIILILVNLFEWYQNSFSKERVEIRNYIYQNKELKKITGEITKLTWQKSSYTSDYNMLKFFVQGKLQSVNVFIYYKYTNKDGLSIQKTELQNISNGNIIILK